ncbi:DUF4038 domain-containing protein [bacterium]|nr:DUF4038 domain-containing protein [bacterium]
MFGHESPHRIGRLKKALRIFSAATILLLLLASTPPVFAQLKISPNSRFLVQPDGSPFFWIGDTFWNWEKFSDAQLDLYVDTRKKQGFTIIQTRAGGPKIANWGEPDWVKLDNWISKITGRGMYAAVGAGWIYNPWNYGQNSIRDKTAMYDLGYKLGHRYRDNDKIIWLSANESLWIGPGGNPDLIKAMNDGIRAGDTGHKLLTVHPLAGGYLSHFPVIRNDVDFLAWQTGRYLAPDSLPDERFTGSPGDFTVWDAIGSDYRDYTKPVIDLEAWYEVSPNELDVEQGGETVYCEARHIRRRAWFTVFAGAFGHTYGAYGLAYSMPHMPVALSFDELLNLPGGVQMGHLRTLISSPARPFLKLVPDQSLITSGQGTANDYDNHKQAARASDGTYAYIYTANGSEFSVDLAALARPGNEIQAEWFNPRDASATLTGLNNPYSRAAAQSFNPPGSAGDDNDWVLVLTAADGNADPDRSGGN